MNATDLVRFPSLEAAYQFLNQPDLNQWVVAARVDAGDNVELDRLNRALHQLVDVQGLALPVLNEQLQYLFSPQEARYTQTMTELTGLRIMSTDSVLQGVRWPIEAAGSAPFDAVAQLGTIPVPTDVKTASASGMMLLRERLDNTVEGWRTRNGIGPIQYQLDIQDDLSQSAVGEMMQQGLLRTVTQLLVPHPALPVQPLQVQCAGRSFTIRITNAHLVRVDMLSPERDVRIQRMADVIAGHACDKSSTHAALLDAANVGFVLLYVRVATAGLGDLRGSDFCEAVRAAEALVVASCPQGHHRWLGAVHYDFTERGVVGFPRRRAHFRPTATWPVGLVPNNALAAFCSEPC